MKEKNIQVKKVTPVFILPQLICEAIFNVPGYTAYCLMPIIQSRYKYLHPDYVNNMIQIPTVAKQRQNLRIDGQFELNVMNTCSVTVAQIREFYLQYIDRRDSQQRFMNCLKNIDFGTMISKDLAVSPVSDLNDDASSHITPADLNLYLTVICKLHPGLEFLRPTPDFQTAYVETCIARIFLENDRRFSNQLDTRQFVRADLLNEFWAIQRLPDLNKCLRYFSYEHFYVIYCQFWQLDSDHDQFISAEELANYGMVTSPYIFYCQCGDDKSNCHC